MSANQERDKKAAEDQKRPSDDAASAPESGTAVNNTSGNQPARPNERPAPLQKGSSPSQRGDDPAVAGEER